MRQQLLSFLLFCSVLFCLTGCGQTKKDDTYITKTSYLLNTIVTVNIYDSTDESLLDGCFEICRKYEALFSRTIETSEIARLNRGEITEVSEETAELIEDSIGKVGVGSNIADETAQAIKKITTIPYPLCCNLKIYNMERTMGVGPTSQAWEARILPMYYARKLGRHQKLITATRRCLTPKLSIPRPNLPPLKVQY